jgi:hypothetical protein
MNKQPWKFSHSHIKTLVNSSLAGGHIKISNGDVDIAILNHNLTISGEFNDISIMDHRALILIRLGIAEINLDDTGEVALAKELGGRPVDS